MDLPALHINTITLKHGDDLGQRLRLARAVGYVACELWLHEIAPHRLSAADRRAAAERYGVAADPAGAAPTDVAVLPVAGVCPPTQAAWQWALRIDAATEASLRATLETAVALAARYVLLPILHPQATRQTVAASVCALRDIAAPAGIGLAIEPVGHIGHCNRVDDMLDILHRCEGDPQIGLILDAFHFFRAGQQLSDLQAVATEQLMTVHINDAIDLPRGQLLGHCHRTYPGCGIWDIEGFCQTLFARGYRGPLVTEILGDSVWLAPVAAAAERAYATSRAVVERAWQNRNGQ